MTGTTHDRQVIVVGRGRLGRAILERDSTAQGFAASDADQALAAVRPGTDILVTAGLTEPKAPRADLMAANFELPKRIIDHALTLDDVRVVTFGTILETVPGIVDTNAYAASKAALARYVEEIWHRTPGRIFHIRLHTLFGGGLPHPHMFSGLMLNALRTGAPLEMTSGRQRREYHSVEQVAAAVEAFLANPPDAPLHDLGDGQAVQLAQIARAVFMRAGRPELLQLGARPDPAHEIWEEQTSPSPYLVPACDPCADVGEWIVGLIGEKREARDA